MKSHETMLLETALEFGLTAEEVTAFRTQIGSNLNGTLPLRLEVGRKEMSVMVAKQGRGAKTLTGKSRRIARFVADRLDFEHIPAVRTAASAKMVVNKLVDRELRTLEENPEYRVALEKISELQRPILEHLSDSIKQTLVPFLPDVRDVRIEISDESRQRAFARSCEVTVDDGAATLLEYKGDGVQSLAALGIMRHASERTEALRNLVIAIEEPESHLHPKAIHELRQVLAQLAGKHQVVLSTHCPLFVNRAVLSSNVLVNNNRARQARNIQEIRDMLGVKASDNLRHAELVLLVEGEEDKVATEPLLRHFSPGVGAAIDNGGMVIDWLSGASNLSYKASLVRDALCSVHCFLDGDGAAIKAFERAKALGILADVEVNMVTCGGKRESELEDLYDPALYRDMLHRAYGVVLSPTTFRNARKWSERMQETFRKQGKLWNGKTEREVKWRIATLVAENPDKAIELSHRAVLENLAHSLEERLNPRTPY